MEREEEMKARDLLSVHLIWILLTSIVLGMGSFLMFSFIMPALFAAFISYFVTAGISVILTFQFIKKAVEEIK